MRIHAKSLVVLFGCLLVLGVVAAGQSGRKQKKADPQPVVQGVNNPDARTVPEPEVVPEKPKEVEKGKAVMVSSAMTDIEIPGFYADTAREACLNELRREVKTIQLSSERNQHRSDAMKAAKDGDTFVVWIELLYDRMGAGSMNGLDMRFTVFEPKTGKSIAFGSGYPRQPGGMSSPPLGASRDQVYVDWAGRDIAQQVIKRLGLRGSF
ncbi:MAG TPA: hypothetical protein PLK30_20980 [Blastocatellia bacterium]|nr:hypothetical protein [Blastocatellia bacterium]